jgi:hypothetical protein
MTMVDNLRLQEARQAAAELRRLQQAAQDLPALEAAANEERRRAELRHKLEALTPGFEAEAEQYHQALDESNYALADLIHLFLDVLEDRRSLDRLGAALLSRAHNLARVRYEAEHPPASTPYDLEDERLFVEGQREQLLIERGCWPLGYYGKVRSPEAIVLLSALGEFVSITYDNRAPTAIPEPVPHDAGQQPRPDSLPVNPVEGGVQRLLEIANTPRTAGA